MAHGNSISEEILTALMKKIFAEELEKQQQSLAKLTSGNFEITMKKIKNIKSKVNELKKVSNLQRGSRRKSSEYAEEK